MSKQTFRKWSTEQFKAQPREYPLWERVAAGVVLGVIVVALVKACGG